MWPSQPPRKRQSLPPEGDGVSNIGFGLETPMAEVQPPHGRGLHARVGPDVSASRRGGAAGTKYVSLIRVYSGLNDVSSGAMGREPLPDVGDATALLVPRDAVHLLDAEGRAMR